jgi:uncharacterized membrane protein
MTHMHEAKTNANVGEHQLGRLFVGSGAVGLLAAGALTYDKLQLLRNPDFHPACNINPVISCGSVMHAAQASVFFGLPNSFFGILGFAALAAAGVALLRGWRPGRQVWLGAQSAATAGLAFILWLMLQSLAVIGALCPWCFVVWLVTIAVFWYVSLYNLARTSLPAGARGAVSYAERNRLVLLGGFYALLVGGIAVRFWYYWRTLL